MLFLLPRSNFLKRTVFMSCYLCHFFQIFLYENLFSQTFSPKIRNTCMWVYACMFVWICVCVHIAVFVCVCVDLNVCCQNTYMCVHAHSSVCVCVDLNVCCQNTYMCKWICKLSGPSWIKHAHCPLALLRYTIKCSAFQSRDKHVIINTCKPSSVSSIHSSHHHPSGIKPKLTFWVTAVFFSPFLLFHFLSLTK